MRRALAILKYVPAVLCGLLVVAWVVSSFSKLFGVGGLWPAGQGTLACCWSTLLVVHEGSQPLRFFVQDLPKRDIPALGFFSIWKDNFYFFVVVALPIPVLLTFLLPLAIGPFSRFRFPLWSYFAWTALIAAELAYYLR